MRVASAPRIVGRFERSAAQAKSRGATPRRACVRMKTQLPVMCDRPRRQTRITGDIADIPGRGWRHRPSLRGIDKVHRAPAAQPRVFSTTTFRGNALERRSTAIRPLATAASRYGNSLGHACIGGRGRIGAPRALRFGWRQSWAKSGCPQRSAASDAPPSRTTAASSEQRCRITTPDTARWAASRTAPDPSLPYSPCIRPAFIGTFPVPVPCSLFPVPCSPFPVSSPVGPSTPPHRRFARAESEIRLRIVSPHGCSR